MNIDNKIYIVGGDHHNGLGLARIFGINGLNVTALVITDSKKSFLSKSRYVNECRTFNTEKEAYDYLSHKEPDSSRAFIIPYSDGSAFELDNRLNEFKDKYYLPSINNEQGKIAELMQKNIQHEVAQKLNIRMAETVTLDINADNSAVVENFVYPCIIKPVISAEGDKRDIAVCKDSHELKEQIEKYKGLNYNRALLQEYLDIDYEIDVFGCIKKSKPEICLIPTKTFRSWPVKGGTNSFSQIITDKKILDECHQIIEKLRSIGFYGLYDIELFVVKDEIILNEINFRNSGDVYMGLAQHYYYPLAWVCDVLGIQYKTKANPSEADYTMTECADIRNVIVKNIIFRQWFKDYKKCSDYALKFHGDMKPAYTRYFYYFKQYLKGKRM